MSVWAHPKEHLWWVQGLGEAHPLWVPMETRYLLWVPLVDLNRGLREEMLAQAYEDRLG